MLNSVKPPQELKKKVLSPKQIKQAKVITGMRGEEKARLFLVKKNYKILGSNIRVGHREIDIIALDQDNKELVFVEVKTRRSGKFGHPALAVNQSKLKMMQTVARVYMKKIGGNKDFRFDVITVLPGKIEHYENVSW